MANCCHSGGIIEGATEIIGSSTVDTKQYSTEIQAIINERIYSERPLGIALTACQSFESAYTSLRLKCSYFTLALVKALEETMGDITNLDLIQSISEKIVGMRTSSIDSTKEQHPGLYCSEDQANHKFLEPPHW
jgi:hypothetical protein